MAPIRTAVRTCPLCEASCGLEISLRSDGNGGEGVQRIRCDRLDVFSKGYLCQPGTDALLLAAMANTMISNVLSDAALDPLSGTSVLNGIPVTVGPAS